MNRLVSRAVTDGRWGLEPGNAMFFANDRCAVNKATWAAMRGQFPRASQLFCMSHFLNSIGQHFKTRELDAIKGYWFDLFSHSDANKRV